MIVVKIHGRLGNQLFQYAFAKSLSKKGFEVKIDISYFKKNQLQNEYQLNEYKIDLFEATKWESFKAKYLFKIPIQENSLTFQKLFLNTKKNLYIEGFFENENYFKEIRAILLKQFIVKKQLSSSTIQYLEKITIEKNTCAVHIKKVAFFSDKEISTFEDECDATYYKNAIKKMREKATEISFFIFSDDISWAKKNLKIKNAVYVHHQVMPHEDLHLMSLCTHNIISKSSFSWWAAWLNQHKKNIIIAPKKWQASKENQATETAWIFL